MSKANTDHSSKVWTISHVIYATGRASFMKPLF